MLAPAHPDSVTLDQLKQSSCARVVAIDWDGLDAGDAKRLRHFGFDEGVRVESLHSGPFGGDPIAVRVGRMTVAIRRRHALAVRVQPEAR